VAYPIPGNDDAGRAIGLYCDLMARAAIEGISQGQTQAGLDLGASETPIVEPLPAASETSAVPQDLSLINGITGTLKKKLSTEGISDIQQIAELTPERVAELDEKLKLKGRIGREEWVEQAQDLVAGKPPREKTQRASA
jgi:small subunit ribosomal protein S2